MPMTGLYVHHSDFATWLHSSLLHDTILKMHNACITPFWLCHTTAWHHPCYAPWLNDTILALPHDCFAPYWVCPMTGWHHSGYAPWLHNIILAVPHDWMTPFWLCPMTGWHHSGCAPWQYDTILDMPMTGLYTIVTLLHDFILHYCMIPFLKCTMTA